MSAKIFFFLKNLKFAIFTLFLIGFISSIGSIIEQDQDDTFYQINYPDTNPLYGFITSKWIFFFQWNHIYHSWYFTFLLILLSISLILCSFYNQLPLLKNSRKFFFNVKNKYFQNQKEFLKISKDFFEKETLLLKIKKLNFYVYENKKFIYAYKSLIGRISPIFVHLSLVLLLFSSSLSSFQNFKAEEIIPKGELARVQNVITLGNFASLPKINIRLNDFWITYNDKKIRQFYSNLSLINNYGNEISQKTISVNKPLIYKSLNIYQSDWNMVSVRVTDINSNIFEYPFLSLASKEKIWISWFTSSPYSLYQDINQSSFSNIVVFDQLRNTFIIYDEAGKFVKEQQVNQKFLKDFRVIEVIKATGLLIKYDPTIPLIYFSFGLLILTTFFSFIPYQRLFIYKNFKKYFIFLSKNNEIDLFFL